MKILVLNGSPKKDKSDTMHITNAFLEGMNNAAPQSVKTIHVTEKRVEYCRGCFTCKRNGGTCVIDDDMRSILSDILDCDILLLNYPLYAYGMPAPLKAVIDRTMPLSSMAMTKVGDRYEHVGQADYSHIRYVMICGCGFPNSKHNFEPAVAQFELMFPCGHTIITVPESPMFNAPEAAPVTLPRLELIKQAGREYAETGKISDELMEKITSPMIPEDVYAAICNGNEPK
ncbi:MAG: flavodoxin family protein [Clostridia bacterium]|nr:flavodoxin family protein [Clostridia bacterium]